MCSRDSKEAKLAGVGEGEDDERGGQLTNDQVLQSLMLHGEQIHGFHQGIVS